MKLKQLLTFALAGTLLTGTVFSASAAELDYEWYAKQNPDVVAAVGDSPEALKLHYEMYGRKEARMANTKDVEAQLRRLFNVEEYAKLYPDVKEFYGDDAEAMFMHYISYGLLEARRPSEKVSQAAATSLKKAVEKALTDAGVAAAPGSVELVAVITGETAALSAASPELVIDSAKLEEVTKALEQVATVVEKAVTETVKAVANPAPAPSNSGSGSTAPAPTPSPSPSTSPSPSPSTSPSPSPSTNPTESPSPSSTPDQTVPTVSAGDVVPAAVVWAPLDHKVSGNDTTSQNNVTTAVSTVNSSGMETTSQNDVNEQPYAKTIFKTEIKIPEHRNGEYQLGYWVGIGVPATTSSTPWAYKWGSADSDTAALQAIANTGSYTTLTSADNMGGSHDGKVAFYFNLENAKAWGYVAIKDTNNTIYRYIINFANVKRGDSYTNLLNKVSATTSE